jgi:hypothetical protein
MSLLDFRFIKRLFNVAPVDQILAVGDQVDAAFNKLQGQLNTVKSVNQNAIQTVNATSGSFAASTPAATMSIVGSGNVSTSISGSTLTITSTGVTVDDSLAYAIALG